MNVTTTTGAREPTAAGAARDSPSFHGYSPKMFESLLPLFLFPRSDDFTHIHAGHEVVSICTPDAYRFGGPGREEVNG